MYRALACCWLLVGSGVLAAEAEHKLMFLEQASEIVPLLPVDKVLAHNQDAAIVVLGEDEMDAFVESVHETFGRCGGFIDVTDQDVSEKNALGFLKSRLAQLEQAPLLLKGFDVSNEQKAQIVSMLLQVKPERLLNVVDQLSAFSDRSASTNDGTKASEWIAQSAKAIGKGLDGWSVRSVPTRLYPKQASVVASLPGTKPELGHVVIGAHMDTLSYGKPGADDDASGSATVFEALRVIASQKTRFERTVDFVWYAAEERGLIGSQEVVRDFRAKGIPVEAALQLDMTGWVDPNRTSDLYLTADHTDPLLTSALRSWLSSYLPTLSVGQASCGYACSDHASWQEAGVPAVYPFESRHDVYNRAIHSAQDTSDKLSAEHMADFAKIALIFLGEVARVQN